LIRQIYKTILLSGLSIYILSCNLLYGDHSSNVLFQDDFSNINSGWNRVNDGNFLADYDKDSYRIFVDSEHMYVWANPGYEFTDSIIEVEVTKISGPDDNFFGILCRYQNPGDFYGFFISSDGFYAIAKRVDGEQKLISSEYLEYSDVINKGNVTNKIRGECVGNDLVLWLNEHRIAEVSDKEIKIGDIGLIAGTLDSPGTDIKFDNLVVKKP
jgi:hypothetical protein